MKNYCKVCEEETTCVYNINFKATPICEKCGRKIAYQEIEDMFRKLKDNTPSPSIVS